MISDVGHYESFLSSAALIRSNKTGVQSGISALLVYVFIHSHDVDAGIQNTHSGTPAPCKSGGKFNVIETLAERLKAIFQSVSTRWALFTILVTFIRQTQAENRGNTRAHTEYKEGFFFASKHNADFFFKNLGHVFLVNVMMIDWFQNPVAYCTVELEVTGSAALQHKQSPVSEPKRQLKHIILQYSAEHLLQWEHSISYYPWPHTCIFVNVVISTHGNLLASGPIMCQPRYCIKLLVVVT